jgi:hypothetical protein
MKRHCETEKLPRSKSAIRYLLVVSDVPIRKFGARLTLPARKLSLECIVMDPLLSLVGSNL